MTSQGHAYTQLKRARGARNVALAIATAGQLPRAPLSRYAARGLDQVAQAHGGWLDRID